MPDAKKNILIVDDDPDFLFLQKTNLEAAGFNVVTAESAGEAARMLADIRPDLAILDLMMEEVDAGFTLCHHIKKSFPSTPIIMITSVNSETGLGFDAATPEERAWIKVDAMLPKPIRFEQLQAEIEKLLKG